MLTSVRTIGVGACSDVERMRALADVSSHILLFIACEISFLTALSPLLLTLRFSLGSSSEVLCDVAHCKNTYSYSISIAPFLALVDYFGGTSHSLGQKLVLNIGNEIAGCCDGSDCYSKETIFSPRR